MYINEKLDAFFEKEYKPSMENNGHLEFCPDGLLKKGLRPKNQDKLWHKSRKIVILLKDCYTGDDARDYKETCKMFGKTIAAWIDGLSKINRNNKPPLNIKYKAFDDPNNTFSIVNIKKQKGSSSVKDSEIKQYGRLYGNLTLKELEILKPNLIVCGGEIVFYVLENYIYGGSEIQLSGKSNKSQIYIFKYQNREFYVAKTYHPSARMKYSHKYDDLIDAFTKALGKRALPPFV